MSRSQPCPACLCEVDASERYPRYLCAACLERASDRPEGGRRVEFSVGFLTGGVAGRYPDSGEDYASELCFVGDLMCRAEQARFGGIVVQALSPEPQEPDAE